MVVFPEWADRCFIPPPVNPSIIPVCSHYFKFLCLLLFSLLYLIFSATFLSLLTPTFYLTFYQNPLLTYKFLSSLCRMEAVGYQRVLQVDLEVNGLMVTQGSREVTWQVEYPLTRTLTSEVQTLIRLAPQDLGGIVPLAMVRSDWLEIGSMCA